MKKFAYLDYAGILHITKYEATAKSHSKNGKYVATYVKALHGYPVDEKENAYILYSETEEKHGYEIPEALVSLYKLLK